MTAQRPTAFHLLAKSTGAVCNLDCAYCFFLSKEMLCPGSRFIETPNGEPGLNYLCAGYKAFFHHIDRPMKLMTERLRHGGAPSEIVALYTTEDARRGRNEPCTCGSGSKWKSCHGSEARVR
ncbi:MAG TPA: SEC-C metal-binding domain-containing protein [Gaiellaceae bacterium]|nr:SEC-C metal-binding domain-containing protein [Gaiellaceae bacterium]